jgi:hypothetical protein
MRDRDGFADRFANALHTCFEVVIP